MNRRTFFNGLGAAIIGTAIALKIPESLMPTRIPFEFGTLTVGEVIFWMNPETSFKISDDKYYGFGFYNSEEKQYNHFVVENI